jgi:hypothetical protein
LAEKQCLQIIIRKRRNKKSPKIVVLGLFNINLKVFQTLYFDNQKLLKL